MTNAFKAAQTPAATAATTKAQPIGDLVVSIGGFTFFDRAVWAESTGKVEILNDFNELMLSDPAKACEIVMNMMRQGAFTVEYKARTNLAKPEGFDWSKFL